MFSLFISLELIAQNTQSIINSTLNGRVLDRKTQEPIFGASVQIKGTTHGVQTDVERKFYFQTGQKFPYTLVISFIGFKTKEVMADNGTVTVLIEEDIKQLSDLVVVGYGSQRKKNITGSVVSVPKENLNQITPLVDNLLRGAIPGAASKRD